MTTPDRIAIATLSGTRYVDLPDYVAKRIRDRFGEVYQGVGDLGTIVREAVTQWVNEEPEEAYMMTQDESVSQEEDAPNPVTPGVRQAIIDYLYGRRMMPPGMAVTDVLDIVRLGREGVGTELLPLRESAGLGVGPEVVEQLALMQKMIDDLTRVVQNLVRHSHGIGPPPNDD